jgi:ankyrin repeat protein
MVEFLLQHGANLNAGPHTSLQRAAANGHLAVVKVLLKRGAQVNARCPRCGQTPLRAATAGGHADIAALLQKHGARP